MTECGEEVRRLVPDPRLEYPAQVDWLELVLLVGIFAIFSANAAAAWVDPDGFRALIDESALGRCLRLDHTHWSTTVIAVNDAMVGSAAAVALVRRTWRRIVLGYAGLWLVVAATVKISTMP